MEINILKSAFNKLMEALKISRDSHSPIEIDPAKDRMVREFSVQSDGIDIKGNIVFPKAKPDRLYPAIIICHGIPGGSEPRPKDDPGYEDLSLRFSSLGFAAVFFNFRGCGDSGGNFDIVGWTRDLEAVLDHVKNTPHIDPTRIVVLGFSGGGATAVRVAAESQDIYAMAIVGTPASFKIFQDEPEEIIADLRERGIIRDPDFPKDIDEWLEGFEEVEPLKWISHFKGRYLLIVHGDMDELIPIDQARDLYRTAPGGITKFVEIPGGVHRLRLDKRVIQALNEWLMDIIN